MATEKSVATTSEVVPGFGTQSGATLLWKLAEQFAKSDMVPETFRSNPGNCMIALDAALQRGIPALTVFQNLNIIRGRLSWSAKYLIASFNTCGRYEPLAYEFEGKPGTEQYGCRATTTVRATKSVVKGPLVTMAIARSEGWTKNAKWTTMPELMLRYRAASWLINTMAPELSMGLLSQDEAEDIGGATDDAMPPNEPVVIAKPTLGDPVATVNISEAQDVSTGASSSEATSVAKPTKSSARRSGPTF